MFDKTVRAEHKRRVCVVNVGPLSILAPGMNEVKQVIDEGSTFTMSGDEGEKLPEEMGDINSLRGGGDEVPFLTEMADILSLFSLLHLCWAFP